MCLFWLPLEDPGTDQVAARSRGAPPVSLRKWVTGMRCGVQSGSIISGTPPASRSPSLTSAQPAVSQRPWICRTIGWAQPNPCTPEDPHGMSHTTADEPWTGSHDCATAQHDRDVQQAPATRWAISSPNGILSASITAPKRQGQPAAAVKSLMICSAIV
jgi:hypothetical protein